MQALSAAATTKNYLNKKSALRGLKPKSALFFMLSLDLQSTG